MRCSKDTDGMYKVGEVNHERECRCWTEAGDEAERGEGQGRGSLMPSPHAPLPREVTPTYFGRGSTRETGREREREQKALGVGMWVCM